MLLARAKLVPTLERLHAPLLLPGTLLSLILTYLAQLKATRPERPSPTLLTEARPLVSLSYTALLAVLLAVPRLLGRRVLACLSPCAS